MGNHFLKILCFYSCLIFWQIFLFSHQDARHPLEQWAHREHSDFLFAHHPQTHRCHQRLIDTSRWEVGLESDSVGPSFVALDFLVKSGVDQQASKTSAVCVCVCVCVCVWHFWVTEYRLLESFRTELCKIFISVLEEHRHENGNFEFWLVLLDILASWLKTNRHSHVDHPAHY